MSESVVVGKPVNLGFHYPQAGAASTMDPRNAMATALMAFVGGLVFTRSSLGSSAPQRFKLDTVYANWPDAAQPIDYPAASVTNPTDTDFQPHNFVPTPLPDTRDVFCPRTVLWKTSEGATDFQVDFWANEEPTREAILARLPQAFSPSEDRVGVYVHASERYYSRLVRLTLQSYRRIDDGARVYQRERRVLCNVRAEMDIVQLRSVAPYDPQIILNVQEAGAEACTG